MSVELARHIKQKLIRLSNKVSKLILGVHPNNTFFSFNWHNVRHINDFLLKQIAQIKEHGLTLADIGGGRSPYYFHFADIVSEYIVVDLKESLPINDERPIKQFPGWAEKLPIDDCSVDIVLCNQVLEHVEDPVQVVREIHRVLKTGGHFMGSVPHVSPIHLEPNDFRRYTSLGVEQLLHAQGFDNVQVQGNGGVFTAASLMILMDMLLSKRREGMDQRFHCKWAVVMSPVVGFVNLSALFADKLFGNRNRTPANLCWNAVKTKPNTGDT